MYTGAANTVFLRQHLLTFMATAVSTFSSAHRLYVKSLYKRYLTNALDWSIRRDIWRGQAMQIRAEFEKNRCVRFPSSSLFVDLV